MVHIMRIPSNKVKDIRRFMKMQLAHLYDDKSLAVIADALFVAFADFNKNELYVSPDKTVSESVLLKLNTAIKQLQMEVPLEYITGRCQFYGLEFQVNEHVLIPRPETEELVSLALEMVPDSQTPLNILDACTGSGCIAVVLKNKQPQCHVSACDISVDALQVAQLNAVQNHVAISFFEADILDVEAFSSDVKFNMLVSNPPYVKQSESLVMKRNVLDYEPHLALFVEDDAPLLFYDALARLGQKCLYPGGTICCEINEMMGNETADLFRSYNFENVIIHLDINGKERFVSGVWERGGVKI